MLNLDDDERVSDILPVEEFSDDKYVFMATKKGITKKTNLSHFARKWKSGIKAINLDEDDKALSEKELKKRYKKISERRVKLGLLMQHIASEEKVVVSEEEINKGILQYTRQYPGQEKQIMEYFEKNPSSLDTIRAPLIEQKVIDSIISKSKTNVIKLSEDDYKKLEVKTFDIKDTKK